MNLPTLSCLLNRSYGVRCQNCDGYGNFYDDGESGERAPDFCHVCSGTGLDPIPLSEVIAGWVFEDET